MLILPPRPLPLPCPLVKLVPMVESGPDPEAALEASDGVGEASLEIVDSNEAGLVLSLGRDLATRRTGDGSRT